MEAEKLTLKWICKYYKAKIKYDGEVYNVIMIHTLNDMIAIHYKGVNASQTNTVAISDCKLILRPLSSLTDEEKKKCLKFMVGLVLVNTHSFDSVDGMLNYCFKGTRIKLIDYLRSINIDIDGLQEKGVAVYE